MLILARASSAWFHGAGGPRRIFKLH